MHPNSIARASGVQTKGGNIALDEYVHVFASPYRNHLMISNDAIGDLRIIIGGRPEDIAQRIADGNFLLMNGISTVADAIPAQNFWNPYPVITDDIYLVAAEPGPDFKATVITDSRLSLQTLPVNTVEFGYKLLTTGGSTGYYQDTEAWVADASLGNTYTASAGDVLTALHVLGAESGGTADVGVYRADTRALVASAELVTTVNGEAVVDSAPLNVALEDGVTYFIAGIYQSTVAWPEVSASPSSDVYTMPVANTLETPLHSPADRNSGFAIPTWATVTKA